MSKQKPFAETDRIENLRAWLIWWEGAAWNAGKVRLVVEEATDGRTFARSGIRKTCIA